MTSEIDQALAFYALTVKERDLARAKADRLERERDALIRDLVRTGGALLAYPLSDLRDDTDTEVSP